MKHIAHFNAAGLASQNREDVRDSIFIAGIVRCSGGEEFRVRVRNLSAGGMMAECDADFAQGDAVTIALRGIGRVTGKVAWKTEDRIGVSFDTDIDPKAARIPVGRGGKTPDYAKPLLSKRPGLKTG